MSNGNDEKNGKFNGRTYLYIRTHPSDDGTEPLPAGLPFWISPDINIIQSSGIKGEEAIADKENQLEVIITNAGGLDVVDAYVEAFVADPSTAFTPSTASPIGNAFITIPGYNTSPIIFRWTPTVFEAGHRCLLARVCLTIPPDSYRNGNVFDVVGDRHVAQRNIHIIKLTEEKLSFGFKIVNPLSGTGEFLVKLSEIKVEKRIKIIRRALGCEFAQFAETPLNEVVLDVGNEILPYDKSVPEKGKDELSLGVLPKVVELNRGKSSKLKMKKGEIRHAIVTVARNPKVRLGDLHVIQVEQINVKNEHVVGGLWLVLQNS